MSEINKDGEFKKFDDFINKLYDEINLVAESYKFPKKFIKENNLMHFPIRKNFSAKDLPIEFYLGKIYLIGKSTIIESYSWIDNNLSVSFQTNYLISGWQNEITMNHISLDDFDPSIYRKLIKDIKYYSINDSNKSIDFILSLLSYGLQIYIKDYSNFSLENL